MPQQPEPIAPSGSVQHLNPDGLHNVPDSWTNMIVVNGPVKTIYLSGLGATDPSGKIVGPDDITAQADYVLKSIRIALAAAGAGPEHLIKMTYYLAQGQSMAAILEPLSRFWEERPNPPAGTVMYVTGFEPPEYLLVIDALAVVPLTS